MNLLDSLDALLISNPINIRYLTGFIGLAPEERESHLLLTRDKTYLFVGSLYLEQANKLQNLGVRDSSLGMLEIVLTTREEPLAMKLKEILATITPMPVPPANPPASAPQPSPTGPRLGFEESDLTVTEYLKLRAALPETQLLSTKFRVEILRMYKKPTEIESIRQAATLTDEALTDAIGKLTPGVTEAEIAWEIESYFKKRNAGIAFPPIIAFGGNSSQPHYASGQTKLQEKDIVLLDFAAKVNGYCADMTRMVFMGEPSPEVRRAYETLAKAQQTGLDLLANGERSGAKLDQAVRDVLTSNGYPVYQHTLGHSLGLSIHEPPRLSVKQDMELKTNMVVTVEPGIYVEGQYGIRIEDLVLLKDDGIEVMSTSTKKLIII